MRAARTTTTSQRRLRRWLLAAAIAAALLILVPAGAFAGTRSSQAAGKPARAEADIQSTSAPDADDRGSSVLIWVVAGIAVLAIMTPSGGHYHYRDPYHEHWH
ncbi:MAG TPA: hypothetical protein VKG45_03160 [Actinomycetes bacterium]|nr:hypothetical protein [Actinomycetes bacterium]